MIPVKIRAQQLIAGTVTIRTLNLLLAPAAAPDGLTVALTVQVSHIRPVLANQVLFYVRVTINRCSHVSKSTL